MCFVRFGLEMCFAPQRFELFGTSQLPKAVSGVLCTWQPGDVFCITTTLFDVSTTQSGLRPSLFDAFDVEICFAPQRRALLASQLPKWPELVRSDAFDLEL